MSHITRKPVFGFATSNNKGADQTARLHRLICAFVVRIWHKNVWILIGITSAKNKNQFGRKFGLKSA